MSGERPGLIGRAAFAAAAAMLVAVAVAASGRLQPIDGPGVATTFAAALLVACAITARTVHGVASAKDDASFLGLVLVPFLASRVGWVLWAPTLPFSDFAFYDQLAREVAAGGPVSVRWPQMGLIAAWGYGLALGGVYRAFGAELLVAKLFNVALGVASLLALYALSRRVAGRVAGLVACVLFVLWPRQLLYTGVLASEHLAVPLLLVALILVARLIDREENETSPAASAALGVVLAAGYLTRSVAGTLVLVVLAALSLGRFAARQRLVRCAIVLTVLLSTVGLYRMAMHGAFGVTPASGGWWSVYVGANFEHGGRWNLADAERYSAHPDISAADRFARDGIRTRIAAAPGAYALLVVRKVRHLWEDGTEGTFWSTYAMADGPAAARLRADAQYWDAAAQSFHVVVLLLAAAGVLLGATRPSSPGSMVLLAFVLVATLAHGIVETQARYSFTLVPVLLVFAASAVEFGVGARDPERGRGL